MQRKVFIWLRRLNVSYDSLGSTLSSIAGAVPNETPSTSIVNQEGGFYELAPRDGVLRILKHKSADLT